MIDKYSDALQILCDKVEGISDKSWEDLVEELGLNCHPDSLRKSFNVGQYSGYQVAKYYENKIADGITSNDEIKRLEQLKYDIVKERKKRESINREYNNHARIEGRNELFQELMIDEIKNLKPIEIKDIKMPREPLCSTGVLVISDAHYGKSFELLGLNQDVVNAYSPAIFQTRMWTLKNDLMRDKKRFSYDKLLVMDCGDCIDGILRMGSLQKLDSGVVESVMQYAEIMSQWLCELHNDLKIPIEYSLRGGNHDMIRLLTEKKIFEEENVGKLIREYIDLRIRLAIAENKIPKSSIVVADYSDVIYHDLYGMKVLSYHGDSKNMKDDIDFFENFYNVNIDIIIGGHLHSNQQETIGYGTMGDREIMRVPSIMGVDDYGKRIRKLARAGVKFMIFNEYGKDLEKTYFLN
jgi:hypothetical protein